MYVGNFKINYPHFFCVWKIVIHYFSFQIFKIVTLNDLSVYYFLLDTKSSLRCTFIEQKLSFLLLVS